MFSSCAESSPSLSLPLSLSLSLSLSHTLISIYLHLPCLSLYLLSPPFLVVVLNIKTAGLITLKYAVVMLRIVNFPRHFFCFVLFEAAPCVMCRV